MIEWCNKRRMLLFIAFLGGLSLVVIILESRYLHTPDEDVHEYHPILKEKLSPGDLCWKKESFEIVQECDLCSDQEITNMDPLVCVAKGRKELVECKESKTKTFRSCDRVTWLEERRFWGFETFWTILGVFSALAVFVRQKQLDHRMYQKIQRQIAAGV